MQVSPGWLPPLEEAPEERPKDKGRTRDPTALLFSLPLCYGMQRGCVVRRLLLSSTTPEVCECSSFLEGSDSYVETFSTISSPSDLHFQTVAILPI